MKSLLLSTLIFLCSCNIGPKTFVQKAEIAHSKSAFLAKEAIKFDIVIKFGGKTRIDGQMTILTDSSKSRIDYKDGRTIIQDKDKVYFSKEFTNKGSVRFDAYTWSYFFLFPYKLSDQGTKWSDYPNKNLNGEKFLVEKLTFGAGVGDAPDDWYVVYTNMQSHRIDTAAYIVTYRKTQEKAEADPHAIRYSSYTDVEGIPIAMDWSFWGWTDKDGLGSQQIGEARVKNIQFLKSSEVSFEPSSELIEYKK